MKGFTHEPPNGGSIEWYTPAWIFERLGLTFDLDPCHPSTRLPWIPARRTIALPEDGLTTPWSGLVWLNPPYGRETTKWLAVMHEHRAGVALVFSRTDVPWFHDYVAKADLVCFMRKRVKFVDKDGVEGGSPGCGSILVAWGFPSTAAVSGGNFGHCYSPRSS